jgi:DNA-binding NtrC family response regulator
MIPANFDTIPANILTVDDDPDISIALLDLLEHEGYSVELASTGTEALNRAKPQHFDAVLLDIRLPDLGSVLQHLSELNPSLPVILHTAQMTMDTPGQNPKSNHAFAYLTKPFNRQELKATLRRAVTSQSS